MTPASQFALDIIDRIDDARSIAEAAEEVLRGLRPAGAILIGAGDTRIQPRVPGSRLVPFLVSLNPPGFQTSATRKFILANNPIPRAHDTLRRATLAWREAHLSTPARDNALWEAYGEFGIADGLATRIDQGAESAFASVGFQSQCDWRAARRTIEIALYALIGKAGTFAPAPPPPPKLTVRERDCLAFVAEGKTDWEISVILGISQSTAHAHIEHARKKLNAASRAQAVARFIILGLM